MPYCEECGAEYEEGTNYCLECGHEVGSEVENEVKAGSNQDIPVDTEKASEVVDEVTGRISRAIDKTDVGTGRLDVDYSVELVEGEEILEERRPSWWTWRTHILLASLLFLFGVLSVAGGNSTVFFVSGLLLPALLLGYVWRERQRHIFVFTNRRVLSVTIASPILKDITSISGGETTEVWTDDIYGMSSGSTFVESLISEGTGGDLGHIKLSFSGGGFSFGAGTRFSIYNYDKPASVIRNSREKRTQNRKLVLSEDEESKEDREEGDEESEEESD